jgi:hypothetical protein
VVLCLVPFHLVCRCQQSTFLAEGYRCQKYSLRYLEAKEARVFADGLDLIDYDPIDSRVSVEEAFILVIILKLDPIVSGPLLNATLIGDNYCHRVMLEGVSIDKGLRD